MDKKKSALSAVGAGLIVIILLLIPSVRESVSRLLNRKPSLMPVNDVSSFFNTNTPIGIRQEITRIQNDLTLSAQQRNDQIQRALFTGL